MFKRLAEIEREDSFMIQVDGQSVSVYRGETLAAVLLAMGKLAMRKTFQKQAVRGYYCGMGICHECLVELQDGTKVRACQTLAEPWMKIKTDT
jgi:aerobic-type carbon monoxide dehydrogenase small subunit (CoxS/CutS family)